MLYLGIANFIRIGFAGSVPMLLVFGFFLTWMCLEDLRLFIRKKYEKGAWLLTHIGRMSGSYIATTTAFCMNKGLKPWDNVLFFFLLSCVDGLCLTLSESCGRNALK